MIGLSSYIGKAARSGALAVAIASAVPGPAFAQRIDTRTESVSKGGMPFRQECAPGSYLVGLNGRGGNSVDAIGAVCQRWNSATRSFSGPDQTFDVVGGNGGSPQVARCLPNAAMSGGMTQPAINDDFSLAYLMANCRRVDMPDQDFQSYAAGRAYFGREHAAASGAWPRPKPTECPAGMWAVGIFGRSGAFVDSLGFICEEGPSLAAPLPPPAPPPLPVAPPTAVRQYAPNRTLVPGPTISQTVNPAVRALTCPAGTEPRRDSAGRTICAPR